METITITAPTEISPLDGVKVTCTCGCEYDLPFSVYGEWILGHIETEHPAGCTVRMQTIASLLLEANRNPAPQPTMLPLEPGNGLTRGHSTQAYRGDTTPTWD